jgi:hypothetical protein
MLDVCQNIVLSSPLYGCVGTLQLVIPTYGIVKGSTGVSRIKRPGWTDPLIAPIVETLKLAIYLFLEFWLQI